MALPVMERALSKLGVNVETATTDDDGRGKRSKKPLASPIVENGVLRWYFPKQTEFYKVSLPFTRWLKSNVQRFDVVHIHAVFSFTSIAAARIARSAGVPYILRPLGLLNRYGMTRRRATLKKLSWRVFERKLLRDAAAVHFTSHHEQDEAEQLGQAMRAAVIPLGIEPPARGDPELLYQRYPNVRNRKLILYLSRIDPKKNLESLLEAVAACSLSFPDSYLLICGTGEPQYIEQLNKLSHKLGLVTKVHWLGHVGGDLKQSVLAAADLFVLPSFSENFGIAAVEALFAGLPCLLSPGVAIAGEVERFGAGQVVESQPKPLEMALRKVLGSDRWKLDAGRKAQLLANQHYAASVMGDRLLQLYEQIGNFESASRALCSTK